MKYVVMFTSRPDLDQNVEPEHAKAVYGRIYQWFQDNGEHIADSGAELHPVTTATTVKYGESGPVVVDGPFNEAKEIIGGFSVLEAADLDGAIAIAKTWPALELPGVALEIRPMVEDYSQFE
ncbi:YciI family protein [Nocardioides speluncae]|uniref:YciI family protein n=1 Tax=Nocardioides speluncae TaxID=2670337 RepID=UPI000D69F249|nr:YciI family protein [Nocardioides speluncae]